MSELKLKLDGSSLSAAMGYVDIIPEGKMFMDLMAISVGENLKGCITVFDERTMINAGFVFPAPKDTAAKAFKDATAQTKGVLRLCLDKADFSRKLKAVMQFGNKLYFDITDSQLVLGVQSTETKVSLKLESPDSGKKPVAADKLIKQMITLPNEVLSDLVTRCEHVGAQDIILRSDMFVDLTNIPASQEVKLTAGGIRSSFGSIVYAGGIRGKLSPSGQQELEAQKEDGQSMKTVRELVAVNAKIFAAAVRSIPKKQRVSISFKEKGLVLQAGMSMMYILYSATPNPRVQFLNMLEQQFLGMETVSSLTVETDALIDAFNLVNADDVKSVSKMVSGSELKLFTDVGQATLQASGCEGISEEIGVLGAQIVPALKAAHAPETSLAFLSDAEGRVILHVLDNQEIAYVKKGEDSEKEVYSLESIGFFAGVSEKKEAEQDGEAGQEETTQK